MADSEPLIGDACRIASLSTAKTTLLRIVLATPGPLFLYAALRQTDAVVGNAAVVGDFAGLDDGIKRKSPASV